MAVYLVFLNTFAQLTSIIRLTLAGWLSWLECHPAHRKAAGLILSQGTYQVVGLIAGQGMYGRQLPDDSHIDVYLSHCLPPSSFPLFPVYLKSIKISLGEDLKK